MTNLQCNFFFQRKRPPHTQRLLAMSMEDFRREVQREVAAQLAAAMEPGPEPGEVWEGDEADGSVVVPFGKHKGTTVDELPYAYVAWMLCGPNTKERWQNGNYGYVRDRHPDVFSAMKERLKREIDAL